MTIRGLVKVVSVAGRELVVRELTAAELRRWISESGEAPFDLINEKLLKTPLSFLAAASGTSLEELQDLLPDTELKQIEDAARECNPSFFGLLGLAAAAAPPT